MQRKGILIQTRKFYLNFVTKKRLCKYLDICEFVTPLLYKSRTTMIWLRGMTQLETTYLILFILVGDKPRPRPLKAVWKMILGNIK